MLECRGRIQGKYPLYLPTNVPFTRKLVERVHVEILHGGVGLTMAAVKEDYWVPKLRRLVKSVRTDCWGCKRSRATAFAAPSPGQLPEDQITGDTAFEVVGTDFAGPIRYRRAAKREEKASVELKTSEGTLERPVQHLCPMELANESANPEPKPLDPNADDFRPKRKAAVEACGRIQAIAEYEQK